MQATKKFHYAWVILACGCAIVGIQLGVFAYTIGNFFLPLSQELGVGVGSISLYHTVSAFASALTFPTAGKLIQKYGMRKVLTITTLGCVAAYAGMSQVTALWQVYLCAGLMGLFSAFYGGATVPSMVNNWFTGNSGTLYGTCLAIGAFAGVAANPIIAAIIKASSWRMGYLAIAAVTAAVMLPVSLFLIDLKPSDRGMEPCVVGGKKKEGGKTENDPTSGVPAEVAFKSKAFLALLVCVPCFGVVYNITNHITTYASVIGIGASAGALLTSISLIGSTLGKLTLGTFSDKKGVQTAVLTAESCAIFGLILVMLSGKIGTWLLFPAVFVFGYGASTTSLMGALMPRAVFGNRDYTKIMSYSSMAMSVGVGLLSPVYGYLYDFTGTYIIAFCFAIMMAVLCMTMATIALRGGKKLREQYK